MPETNSLRASIPDSTVEYATTIPTAPAAPTSQPSSDVVVTPEYAPPPPAGTVTRNMRLSRLLLLRTLRFLTFTGRALWPYRLSITIALVSFLIIGWMGALLWMPRGGNQAASFSRVASIPPAPSVESFIKGQQSFNGELMWESLSDQIKAQLLDRGDSKMTWQTRAEMEKRSGQRYLKYDYVGGVQLQDGESMFFYLVNVQSPRPDRNGPTSYVFTVGQDGKIINIE